MRSAVTRDERRPARLAFTDDELLAQTLRERYLVPVEWSDEADLLRTLLPKSFSSAGRPAPAAGIMPNVDVGSPSPDIAAMVQAHEVHQPLRADALTAQERLERVRQAHRDELEQRRAELKQLQETIRLEQKCVEAERQALELVRARNSIEVERREIYIDRIKREAARVCERSRPAPTEDAARSLAVQSLREECRRHGVTHDAIAKAAGVTRFHVVNVFSGRATSRNVIAAATQLLGQQPDPIHDLNGKVAEDRARLGISQSEVVRRAGIHPSILSRLLAGTMVSSPAQLKLATFLAAAVGKTKAS